MKISIVGWYDKENVGDEAFRKVFYQFFGGKNLIEFVTPPNICRSDTDIVILGGGAVVSPFYLDTLPKNKPIYAMGVDLAYESEVDLISKLPFREILVRNNFDAKSVKKKVSCPVHSIPDLAYYLKHNPQESVNFFVEGAKQHNLVGVFVTDYVLPAIDRPVSNFADRGIRFVTTLAKKLDDLADSGKHIVLVPCSTGGYGNDIRINLDIAAHMRNKPTVIMKYVPPEQMIDLISSLKFSICMRFHSHIFSMIAGTPLVSIEFTRKVKNWINQHDLNHTIGVKYNNDFYWEDFKKAITFAESGESTPDFKKTSANYQNQLEEIKQRVLKEWIG